MGRELKMGWLQDLLKEIPLSSVLRERVILAEEKFEAASKEIENYRQQISALEEQIEALRAEMPAEPTTGLDADSIRVLVLLFKASTIEDRDVGAIARNLNLERGVALYHLERLQEADLAEQTGGNYVHGHVYWALTPAGRRYAVEHKLI